MDISPSHIIWTAAGMPPINDADDHCWLCGGPVHDAIPREEWIKPTFTDFAYIRAPESPVICAPCVWAHSDTNTELTERTGKDKPQRMRNYSHIVSGGEWHPCSKSDKARMMQLLISPDGFPELAVIGESGQIHLVFKALTNPPGQTSGWVQFETQRMRVQRDRLSAAYDTIIELMIVGLNKEQIDTGNIPIHRMAKLDFAAYIGLESLLRSMRGSAEYILALYLATKEAADERAALRESGEPCVPSVAQDTAGLQAEIRAEHLGSIRDVAPHERVHERPKQGVQQTLFPI